MKRRLLVSALAMFGTILLAATAVAAVVSGTIESVSPGGNQLSVRIKAGALKTYRLSPMAQVTVEGKKAAINELETGQAVTVTTDSKGELATKVVVKAAAAAPAEPAAATPKPAATNAAKSRASKATKGPDDSVAPGDWPQYRGPNRDNISTETGLLKEWPQRGPELAWQMDGLGEGYSSVSVVGDTIYTLGTQGRDEVLFALDRSNGRKKWNVRMGSNRNDGMGGGPRGTPTVDGDRVYALGANGDLVCVNAENGNPGWRMNILQEFGGNNIGWGISESVLIDDEKLICTPGGSDATIVALNKQTGRPIWRSPVPRSPSAGYSSAIAIEVDGVRQYVNFVSNGVVGVRATDGTPLWGQPQSSNGTANCSTPVYANNALFSASGYGTGGAMFRLASAGGQTRSEMVYETKQMKNHHGGMVLLDGYVYGFDENILTCFDLKAGKAAWQDRSVGKGSLTYAEGLLYLRSENGPVALAVATPNGYEEKGRFQQPDRSRRQAWAHPVVAGGKLYLRDQEQLLVYNVKQ